MFTPARLLGAIAAAALCAQAALAQTVRYVLTCGNDANSGLNFNCDPISGAKRTIQGAINASANGDTVLVAAGVYNEAINFNGKNITVRAAPGTNNTNVILDGTGLNNAVVTFLSGETASAVLDGFTIRGGTGRVLSPTDRRGGGIYISSASPTIRNCIIADNSADGGGGLVTSNGNPSIHNCTFRGNTAGVGGGVYIIGGSSVIDATVFVENSAPFGGGVSVSSGSGLVRNSTFVANTAATSGSAVQAALNSAITIEGALFRANVSGTGGFGGAISIFSTGTIRNCIFVENRNDNFELRDVHVFPQASNVRIVNSSFYSPATEQFSASVGADGNTTIANCIFWGANNLIRGSVPVTYSIVQGGRPGVGNLNADPRFVSVASANLQLRPGSPAIDAGSNTAAASLVTDAGGRPRRIDDPLTPDTGEGIAPIVDIGAFEYHGPPPCRADFDLSGAVDTADITAFLSEWFAARAGGCP